MAKIIYDDAGQAVGYQPGVIYDLGMIIDGQRIPFYVGETSNPTQRFKDHVRAGENATTDSTLVYQTIKKLNEDSINWTMATLANFGSEGPTDLEDEWIMKHLYDGRKLSNMKKGNANWLAEREAVAGDMKRRGVSSYRKYRAIITQEDADRKHAEWKAQEEERQRQEEERKLREHELAQRLKEQEAENERKGLEEWKIILENDNRLKKQEELRKRIAEETAAKQAEIIRQREEKNKRIEETIAKAAAKWEADRPAREAKIRADTERLKEIDRAKEQKRQEEYEQECIRRQERDRQKQELIQRANITFANWPNLEDRIELQKREEALVEKLVAVGRTDKQIIHAVEVQRNILEISHPGRAR